MKNKNILSVICVAELWDMISFFGIVSILVLYMTNMFSTSSSDAYIYYGLYLTLFCSMPIIGGYITDKYISNYKSLIIGGLLISIGNLLLFLEFNGSFFLGLSLTIVGTSLYKTVCTNLVGIISEESKNKNKAYTVFYTALNIGAIIAPILYGTLAIFSWRLCFLISSIGILFCVILFFICSKSIKKFDNIRKTNHKTIKFISSISLLIFVSTLSFSYAKEINNYIVVVLIVIGILYLSPIFKVSMIEAKRIIGIVILLFFCIFFFAASLQVGSSITIFIDKFVNKELFGAEIPTSYFASLDPLFLVLTAPFFAYLWKKLRNLEPSPVIKLSLGLFIGAMGFVLFLLATYTTGNKYLCLLYILLGYVFIGAGEICLSPAVLTAISDYSPKHITNMMMGGWYFFMSIAGFFGGYIDEKITIIVNKSAQNNFNELTNFTIIFLVIAILTSFAGLILWMLSKKINKEFFK